MIQVKIDLFCNIIIELHGTEIRPQTVITTEVIGS